MNILLSGGGLIGSYTSAELIRCNHQVTIIDANPSKSYITTIVKQPINIYKVRVERVDEIEKALHKENFDAIIHTAAVMKPLVEDDPWKGFCSNVLGTASLFEYANRRGIKNFIFCSSLALYDFTIPSEAITEDHPTSLTTLYEYTKMFGELWLSALAHKFSIQLTILRLAGTYGAGQFIGKAWMGKQLQDLLFLVIKNPCDLIEVNESDFGTNEYLYVKDTAHALSLAVERAKGNQIEILNVGAGKLTSTENLITALQHEFPQATFKKISDPSKSIPEYLQRVGPLDLSKTKNVLGYDPKYLIFEEGLHDYLQEFRKLQKLIR